MQIFYIEIDEFSGRLNTKFRPTSFQESILLPLVKPENLMEESPQHLGFRCCVLYTDKGEFFVKNESFLEELCLKFAGEHQCQT